RRAGQVVFQQEQPVLDRLCLLSLVALAVAIVFANAEPRVTGSLAFASGALHLARMRRYHTLKVFKDPMLWILHAGYAWLVAGFFLFGLYGFGVVDFSPALHALTTGCIGSMCIGMMSRVTLGHTGR